MTTFTPIDLSRLPPPSVIDALDFETIRAEMLADFKARFPGFTADLESDPVVKLIETAAYRELGLRQRINDAARAVMLATAIGADLDHLAALYGVQRLVVDPGDAFASPPRPLVLEEDTRLRIRTQLALEGFSTAGPVGAYIFHALSASARIKDVSVVSPQPGDVVVTVLSTKGDGTPAYREAVSALEVELTGDTVIVDGRAVKDLVVTEGSQIRAAGSDYSFDETNSRLERRPGSAIAPNAKLALSFTRAAELQLVELALTHEDVRPLTDRVTVRAAEIVPYTVEAVLWVHEGPDMEVVRQTALDRLSQHLDELHRLGRDITLSGLYAALHQPGVQRVELTTPSTTLVLAPHQAGFNQSTLITVGGRDE